MELVFDGGPGGGKPLLAGEHEELHIQLARLAQATKNNLGLEAMGATFKFLNGYFHNHFEVEEQLMEVYQFPEAEVHRERHAELTAAVSALNHRFEEWGATEDLLKDLNRFIGQELTTHFKEVDTKLEAFLKTQQEGF